MWKKSNSQILLKGRLNQTHCSGTDIGSFRKICMIQSSHSHIFTQDKWKLMSTQRSYMSMSMSSLFHTQKLNNSWMNKHIVVFPYSGKCSEIKTNYGYMKQHRQTLWVKGDTQKRTYNSLHIKVWEMQINLWWQKAAQKCLGRGWGMERGGKEGLEKSTKELWTTGDTFMILTGVRVPWLYAYVRSLFSCIL